MHLTRRLLPALSALLLSTALTHAEISTWKNLDGAAMEAEFLGRKGDYVSFRKTDGSKYLYPYAKLSAADRARVDALGAPPADTEKPAPAATSPSTPPAGAKPAAPATTGRLVAALSGRLVQVKGSALVASPKDRLEGVRYLAVYYSAHWCPPLPRLHPGPREQLPRTQGRTPRV
jgi:hypothetical protein